VPSGGAEGLRSVAFAGADRQDIEGLTARSKVGRTYRVRLGFARNPRPRSRTRRVRPSAPVKAFDQEGESPSQASVTGLKLIVVTAFPRGRVGSNLKRTTSP